MWLLPAHADMTPHVLQEMDAIAAEADDKLQRFNIKA